MSEVNYEVAGSVATITLNRPQQLNARTLSLMNGVTAALQKVEAEEDVRVVVLTGAGRGFCSGADLSQVAAGSGGEDSGQASSDDSDHPYNQTLQALHNCPVPTIARINGPAAGGGLAIQESGRRC